MFTGGSSVSSLVNVAYVQVHASAIPYIKTDNTPIQKIHVSDGLHVPFQRRMELLDSIYVTYRKDGQEKQLSGHGPYEENPHWTTECFGGNRPIYFTRLPPMLNPRTGQRPYV